MVQIITRIYVNNKSEKKTLRLPNKRTTSVCTVNKSISSIPNLAKYYMLE